MSAKMLAYTQQRDSGEWETEEIVPKHEKPDDGKNAHEIEVLDMDGMC